ncbi:MAG: hypothetical protein M1824_001009 [Vezdaea acicularis]|nr:MAG: hypothetical protein M1824_001009 [Vezdaea acicularis]
MSHGGADRPGEGKAPQRTGIRSDTFNELLSSDPSASQYFSSKTEALSNEASYHTSLPVTNSSTYIANTGSERGDSVLWQTSSFPAGPHTFYNDLDPNHNASSYASYLNPSSSSTANGFTSPPSNSNHLSPLAGYTSENGHSDISEHTTPSFEEELITADFSSVPGLDDTGFTQSAKNNSVHSATDAKQSPNDIRSISNSRQDTRASYGTGSDSTYLLSPVDTDVASPTSIGEDLQALSVENVRLGPTISGSHQSPITSNNPSLAVMTQTPAPTGSSKSSSQDGFPASTHHLMSPVVTVEDHSRTEPFARGGLDRSLSKRSHASQHSTHHLSPDVDAGESSDDEDRAADHVGVHPLSREALNETEMPSINQLEEDRQKSEKNHEVERWLAKSEAGSTAGDDGPPVAGLLLPRRDKLGQRYRAKSVGDPAGTMFGAGHLSPGSAPNIPGPGVLVEEDIADEYTDDGEISESPPASITAVEEPPPPEQSQISPWADLPANTETREQAFQPPTANAAIVKFQQRAAKWDSLSRVATWGTHPRRNSEGDASKARPLFSPFRKPSFTKKEGENEKRPRRGSVMQRILSAKKSASNLTRKDSGATSQSQDHQNRKQSVESLAPPIRMSSFPRFTPQHQTQSAIATMASQIGAVGGTINTPSPAVQQSSWQRGIQLIRSNSQRSHKSPPEESNIGHLWTRAGGPPIPTLASPSLAEKTSAAVSTIAEQAKEEDDFEDEPMEQGVIMDMKPRTDPIIPTYQGFLMNVQELNPRLDPFLADRIAHEQVKRFKSLVKFKVGHMAAVNGGRCTSGEFCFALHGKAKILKPRANQRDPETPFVGFQVSTGTGSDDGEMPFGEGAVAAAQFPLGVPLPPVNRLPAEFECPLCFKVKKFQKPSDWTKHVHEDVQPFTCTWPECTEPKSFKRKADWVRHENERHRKLEWWTCNIPECAHTCYRKDNFVQHLVREHKMPEPKVKSTKAAGKARGNKAQNEIMDEWAASGEDQDKAGIDKLWAMVEQCRFDTEDKPHKESCKFCGNVCNSWKKLTVHLARHMEQISLPVLDVVKDMTVTADTTVSPITQRLPQQGLGPMTPGVRTKMESVSPGGFSSHVSPSVLSSQISPNSISPVQPLCTYPPPFYSQNTLGSSAQHARNYSIVAPDQIPNYQNTSNEFELPYNQYGVSGAGGYPSVNVTQSFEDPSAQQNYTGYGNIGNQPPATSYPSVGNTPPIYQQQQHQPLNSSVGGDTAFGYPTISADVGDDMVIGYHQMGTGPYTQAPDEQSSAYAPNTQYRYGSQ